MQTEQGLISIVTPVYNRENVISDCIRSVLSQSYQNFEMIIVDDGSTDRTYNICKEFAQADQRIKLLASEHAGVSSARNCALNAVRGEYVFFLDSDDVIHPFLLESLYVGLRNTNASIGATKYCHVPCQYWEMVGKLLSEDNTCAETTFYSNADAIDGLMRGTLPFATIGGTIFRKDLICDTRFNPELHISEDYLFNYKNLLKGADCISLSKKWYFVRLHNNNISKDYSYSGFYSRFHRRELVWKNEMSLGHMEYADLQKQDAFNCYLRCLINFKGSGTDLKMMRSVMLQYRRDIRPALPIKQKLQYTLALHFPQVTSKILNKRKNK